MESLLNTLLQNEERIKMIRSNRLENKKMNVFIKNNYSWTKVSELLYDYFMYIIKGA
jgi:hypothetical protein